MALSEGIADVHTRDRVWTKGLVVWAAAVGILVLASITYLATDQESIESVSVVIPPKQVTETELMRDLVNRGLVPEQALEPAARSRDDLMRDLVNRGLVPKQALSGPTAVEDEGSSR